MKVHESYYDPLMDYEFPCPNCGNYPDDCICQECPVCNEVGNPDCVQSGHFHLDGAQIDGLLKLQEEFYQLSVLGGIQHEAEAKWINANDPWEYIETPSAPTLIF